MMGGCKRAYRRVESRARLGRAAEKELPERGMGTKASAERPRRSVCADRGHVEDAAAVVGHPVHLRLIAEKILQGFLESPASLGM